MKKFLLLVIAAILNSGPTYTQQPESAVRAEIKFVTGYGFKPGQKIGTVIVSFINNSDRNIYIPEINSISSGDSTGLFRIYKKIGTGYQAIPFYGGELPPPQTDFDGVFACWMPPFVNKLGERVRLKIVKREKPMKEALKKYFEKNLTASDSAILFFENRPLFLKAHEKRPYYF